MWLTFCNTMIILFEISFIKVYRDSLSALPIIFQSVNASLCVAMLPQQEVGLYHFTIHYAYVNFTFLLLRTSYKNIKLQHLQLVVSTIFKLVQLYIYKFQGNNLLCRLNYLDKKQDRNKKLIINSLLNNFKT